MIYIIGCIIFAAIAGFMVIENNVWGFFGFFSAAALALGDVLEDVRK